MPPMAFRGLVTKVGFMKKTATVTVSRWVTHKITGKVKLGAVSCIVCLTSVQRIERSKKFLIHDEKNRMFVIHPPL
jgi:small subunit ribosomal protein S17